MYVRIAPKSDLDEVNDAQLEYEDTKKKIEEKHPATVSRKTNQIDRRVIGITDFGFGSLTKKGEETVACYYFVVEYCDGYSDYGGGIIFCQDGKSSIIELHDGREKEYTHTFKGNGHFGT